MNSIGKKINLLALGLLFVVASAITILNTYTQHKGMEAELMTHRLPLMSQDILNRLDDKIMEPARGVDLILKNPTLLDWLDKGEPNSELESIYTLLDSITESYNTLGANFVSQATKQYTDLQNGKRNWSYKITEKDQWFSNFRDTKADINIVVNFKTRSGELKLL